VVGSYGAIVLLNNQKTNEHYFICAVFGGKLIIAGCEEIFYLFGVKFLLWTQWKSTVNSLKKNIFQQLLTFFALMENR